MAQYIRYRLKNGMRSVWHQVLQAGLTACGRAYNEVWDVRDGLESRDLCDRCWRNGYAQRDSVGPQFGGQVS